LQQRFAIALPPTSQTANCLQQRNAIALPLTSQTANCLQQRFAIALPQPPKQRTACSSATLSHSPNLPNSELLAAALRYRIPSTSQTENCLQQRNAYAPISLQNI